MYSYIKLDKQTSFPSSSAGKAIIGANINSVLNITDENGSTTFLTAETTSSYYVYTAKITQTSFDDPVATILENTLPFTPNWGRSDAGEYSCNIPTGDPTKIICFIGPTSTNTILSSLYSNNTDTVFLLSMNINGTPSDGLLNNTPVEIRLYK